VFPSLRRQAAAPAVVVQDERFRLHRAVRALLEQLAGRGSLVLALDDIHFADPASCELLASLLRRLPDAPVLLSLTYRSGRAPPAVAGELIAAAGAGRVTRIELGPLGRADADVLMAGIGSASRHRLYAQSGGNPFYLQQLVRSAQTGRNATAGLGPAAEAGEALAGAVPAEVAAVITQELASLPPTAQAVVQAAAVTGDPFEPDLVADIAGVAPKRTRCSRWTSSRIAI
jgi:predicted ATPase